LLSILPTSPLAVTGHKWNGFPVNKKTDLLVRCNDGKALAALKISMVEAGDIQGAILPDREIGEIQKEWESFLEKMPAPQAVMEKKNSSPLPGTTSGPPFHGCPGDITALQHGGSLE
jgi:hypothetical protein